MLSCFDEIWSSCSYSCEIVITKESVGQIISQIITPLLDSYKNYTIFPVFSAGCHWCDDVFFLIISEILHNAKSENFVQRSFRTPVQRFWGILLQNRLKSPFASLLSPCCRKNKIIPIIQLSKQPFHSWYPLNYKKWLQNSTRNSRREVGLNLRQAEIGHLGLLFKHSSLQRRKKILPLMMIIMMINSVSSVGKKFRFLQKVPATMLSASNVQAGWGFCVNKSTVLFVDWTSRR